MCGVKSTKLRVYPRVCGGAGSTYLRRGNREGLSPRVRGSLDDIASGRICWGSIPACAGEPRNPGHVQGGVRVYPRVCGGATHAAHTRCYTRGLSPRVRGSRDSGVYQRSKVGSIPACAGEPASAMRRRAPSRVYPRVCGGARTYHQMSPLQLGLSPRVRGSLHQGCTTPTDNGSIPACAGEPAQPHPTARSPRVYPRVCGGALVDSISDISSLGLSPRVRGSPPPQARHPLNIGSIPACAGEPLGARRAQDQGRVYPRVCGGA